MPFYESFNMFLLCTLRYVSICSGQTDAPHWACYWTWAHRGLPSAIQTEHSRNFPWHHLITAHVSPINQSHLYPIHLQSAIVFRSQSQVCPFPDYPLWYAGLSSISFLFFYLVLTQPAPGLFIVWPKETWSAVCSWSWFSARVPSGTQL